jgi:hypothetical protein
MPEDDTSDGGVLGNLPRSRPGRRSTKRTSSSGSPAKAAGAAARKAEAKDSAAARPAPSTGPKSRARPKSAAGPRRAEGAAAGEGAAQPRRSDPVGDAVRAAAKLAGTGVNAAGGVAREVLRRLPHR